MPVPPILPAAAAAAPQVLELVKQFFEALEQEPAVINAADSTLQAIAPGWAEKTATFKLQNKIRLIERLAALDVQMSQLAEPALLRLAARALGDMFHTPIAPAALTPAHSGGDSSATAGQLSDVLISRVFGISLTGAPVALPPSAEGAQRVLDAVLGTALDSWLGDTIGIGWLAEDLPDFTKLKEVMESHIGLGRFAPRALRPLLDILAAEPLEKLLLKRFTPREPSPAQLAEFLARGDMTEERYFEAMAEQGYSRGWAALMRRQNAQSLSESTLRRMFELGMVTPGVLEERLQKRGYSPADASALVELWRRDAQDGAAGRLVAVARDMFASREIDEPELRQLLTSAGVTGEALEQWVGVALVERSRPRRLSDSQAADAYVSGVWPEDRLRAHYAAAGYAPESVELLLLAAARRKAATEKTAERVAAQLPPAPRNAIRQATALQLNRRGLLSADELRASLRALGLEGPRLEAELAAAAAARAEWVRREQRREQQERGLRVSAGALEDLYVRGLVADAELERFYLEAGFSDRDLPALLQLRQLERQEWLIRHVPAPGPASAPATEPLGA